MIINILQYGIQRKGNECRQGDVYILASNFDIDIFKA